ncbi:MAG: hypothetical protein NVS3B10_05370 [Polyangiales bacterium]
MKTVSFALHAVVLLAAASACRHHKGPKGAKGHDDDGAAQGPGGESGSTQNAPGGAGSCETSCQHYLQCKNNFDPSVQGQCVAKCGQMHLTRASLLVFEATDCAAAISAVEGASTGHNGATGAGSSGSADCKGCVWDGSSCIWLSSGNWGAGPYSGAAADCEARCCAAH